jgi:hypothetical protein
MGRGRVILYALVLQLVSDDDHKKTRSQSGDMFSTLVFDKTDHSPNTSSPKISSNVDFKSSMNQKMFRPKHKESKERIVLLNRAGYVFHLKKTIHTNSSTY